jgi:hypothetical protein
MALRQDADALGCKHLAAWCQARTQETSRRARRDAAMMQHASPRWCMKYMSAGAVQTSPAQIAHANAGTIESAQASKQACLTRGGRPKSPHFRNSVSRYFDTCERLNCSADCAFLPPPPRSRVPASVDRMIPDMYALGFFISFISTLKNWSSASICVAGARLASMAMALPSRQFRGNCRAHTRG